MRKLTKLEMQQRGCHYCENRVNEWNAAWGCYRSKCPHESCPYGILDKFDTYDAFVESKDCRLQFLPD